MIDIYYLSGTTNEKISLVGYPYRIRSSDLLNYAWETKTNANNMIIGFQKKLSKKNILLSVFGRDEETYNENLNRFFEITERDLLSKKAGKLYFNNHYISCYITASNKSEWEYEVNFLDNDITIVSSNPFWTQETTYTFKSSEIKSSNNKRYPYKYPYRYANGLTNTTITNAHYVDCNFKLLIYGRCINPTVIIGGNIYKVHTLIEEGERLEIDSKNKTVVKVRNSGYIENLFNSRDKVNDVFRKIKTGVNSVNWNGDFDFDIVLYEERSEPKWI